jgi:hypothetical protein
VKFFVAYSVLDNQTDEQVVIKRARLSAGSFGEAKSMAESVISKVAGIVSCVDAWYGVALRDGTITQDAIYVSVHEWKTWGAKLDDNWDAITAYTPELGDEDD